MSFRTYEIARMKIAKYILYLRIKNGTFSEVFLNEK